MSLSQANLHYRQEGNDRGNTDLHRKIKRTGNNYIGKYIKAFLIT
jgi:hypothetical protein